MPPDPASDPTNPVKDGERAGDSGRGSSPETTGQRGSRDPSRTLETRKLQQVGGGTYTVSIPKEWAEARGLEAGAQVRLYTHVDGSIVLESPGDERPSAAAPQLTVAGSRPDHAIRTLEAAYAVGFDVVTLVAERHFSDAQHRAVRQGVRALAGSAIVAERADRITVKNLLDATDVSIDQSLRQILFITLTIHRQGMAAVLADDPRQPAGLADRIADTGRLGLTMGRHWQRCLISLSTVDQLGTDHPLLFDRYETARQLQRVGANGTAIVEVAGRLDGPLPDPLAADLHRLARTARTVVDTATGAVLAGDPHRTSAILDRRPGVEHEFEAMATRLFDNAGGGGRDADATPPAYVAATRILDELRATADAGFEVAEIAMRAGTREASGSSSAE